MITCITKFLIFNHACLGSLLGYDIFLFSYILLVLAPVIFGCTLEGFYLFLSFPHMPSTSITETHGLRGCHNEGQ